MTLSLSPAIHILELQDVPAVLQESIWEACTYHNRPVLTGSLGSSIQAQ